MGGGKIKRGRIPRGIEVLVKKAAVDGEFYNVLLAERSDASVFIGLNLTDIEAAILDGIPDKQLTAIIANTRVKEKHIPAFTGYAAAAMLAAVGFIAGCGGESEEEYDHEYEVTGIDPSLEYLDNEPGEDEGSDESTTDENAEEIDVNEGFGTGIRPDLPNTGGGEEETTETNDTGTGEGEIPDDALFMAGIRTDTPEGGE